MPEIFNALTGELLGVVNSLYTHEIADFLNLPSRWHVNLCDVNKVVLVDRELADALHKAHTCGEISEGFESNKQVVQVAVAKNCRFNSLSRNYAQTKNSDVPQF
jgi:hypothetical protein